MSIVLVNPNLVFQGNDPFTTGIVYMPISLAYFASALLESGKNIHVIDAFAENPHTVSSLIPGSFLVGIDADEVLRRIIKFEANIVCVYAINVISHISTLEIIKKIKKHDQNINVVVIENTQAVTAYQLSKVAQEFFEIGADYCFSGEAEINGVELIDKLVKKDYDSIRTLKGVSSIEFKNEPAFKIKDLDKLPFPAWHLFPLENYWSIKFGHGPFYGKKYLPLLTSRGCPYSCAYCVIPGINNRKWRYRSAGNVVNEIEYFVKKFGVTEFHLEDLNPTIDDNRIRQISSLIIERNLNISWKIVAGTKVESIKDEETVSLMAKSGCKYVSISPESGSQELLKKMVKPFDMAHGIRTLKLMKKFKIKVQTCFLLGFPSETNKDRFLTLKAIFNLTRHGADEIAVFIVTPVPGSRIFEQFSGYKNLSQLNFSPIWREDYKFLNKFRILYYLTFLVTKFLFYPHVMIFQLYSLFAHKFETKMEMVVFRARSLRKIVRNFKNN